MNPPLHTSLEKILKEEKNKLGLTNNIEIELMSAQEAKNKVYEAGYSSLEEAGVSFLNWANGVAKHNGRYIFLIQYKDLLKTKRFRSVCRHELYHIAAGHCETNCSWLRRQIFEVQAEFYQYLRINFNRKLKKTLSD